MSYPSQSTPFFYMLYGLFVLLTVIPPSARAFKFADCNETIVRYLTQDNTIPLDPNGTITSLPYPDPIYHGAVFGFHADRAQRPVTITYEGCKNVCSTRVQINTVNSAFEILTTWVLPVIALLSSFPYESNDVRKNFEAFANWVGAPAAALTSTVWNLLMIRRCQKLAERDPTNYAIKRDTLFILSCVNQYQYQRRGYKAKRNEVSIDDVDGPRDQALLRGVLFPFLDHPDLQTGKPLRQKLENISFHLAFQLRLQRRRGVYPLTLSIGWFLLAFVVSVVTAFAQLGDNTTAHSLALGLLLSWLPILVVAAVVDRNPVSATRCGILIERWLYNVDALFEENRLGDRESVRTQLPRVGSNENLLPPQPQATSQPYVVYRRPLRHNADYEILSGRDVDDDGDGNSMVMSPLSPQVSAAPSFLSQDTGIKTARGLSPAPRVRQWRQNADLTPFKIQDYVGQGRRLRYCAVTDTVLDLLESANFNLRLPGHHEAHEFKLRLPKRPAGWYATWFLSQFLVAMAFAMAFMVSFNTPTIGLGCRSLAYVIWWSLSTVSWLVLLVFQEPPKLLRKSAWVFDVLAFCSLFTLMGFQMTGGLNRCICKVSIFGSSKYGGYMDFQNAQFYHTAYDVRQIWGIATGCGLATSSLAIIWLYHRWSRDSMLWKFKEEDQPPLMDGVDLHWLT